LTIVKGDSMSRKKESLKCCECDFLKMVKGIFKTWTECRHPKPKDWKIQRDGCPKKRA